jgi:hypothetical protein
LFLGTPRDNTVAKKHSKTRSGAAIIWTSCPIGVTEGMEMQRGFGEDETMITGIFKEAKDALGSSPMATQSTIHEATQAADHANICATKGRQNSKAPCNQSIDHGQLAPGLKDSPSMLQHNRRISILDRYTL